MFSADGVVYSFGEFFKEFLKHFKTGNAVTSLIPSILVGTTLCSGNYEKILNRVECVAIKKMEIFPVLNNDEISER